MTTVNPYAPPSDDVQGRVGPVSAAYAVGDPSFGPERSSTHAHVGKTGKAAWKIGFHDGGLLLHDPEGEAQPVTRDEVIGQFDVTPLGRATLLRWEPRKLHLRLEEGGGELLRTWARPMIRRWGEALSARRYKGRLVSGLIFAALTGLLWSGGEIGLLLPMFAVGALVAGIGARLGPGRWLFAWNGAYSLALALLLMAEIGFAGRHWGWSALVAVFAWAGVATLRKHSFLRPLE